MLEPAVTFVDVSRLCADASHSNGWLAALVGAASLAPAGSAIASGIACNRRPDRHPCTGRITLWRQEVPARISWSCAACRARGTLAGWKGTSWDLGRLATAAGIDDEDRRTVHLEPRQYDLLLRELPPVRSWRACALGARAHAESVLIEAPLDSVEELASWLAEEVEQAQGPRRRRLDRLCDRLERALSQVSPSVETPLPEAPLRGVDGGLR